MATIEERAKLCQQYQEIYGGNFASAYKKGAESQRKIDIDKACEWFTNYLFDIGYPDDWCRDSKVLMSGEERFRKAMEE